MYPIKVDRRALFHNEIYILRKFKGKFHNDTVKNGIVSLINNGEGNWKHDYEQDSLPGRCLSIVYTFGLLLFPVLKQKVQSNDTKMLFWYFSQMVRTKLIVFNIRFDY